MKGTILLAAVAAWSDTLFFIRGVEDNLSFLLSTKVLSIAILEPF